MAGDRKAPSRVRAALAALPALPRRAHRDQPAVVSALQSPGGGRRFAPQPRRAKICERWPCLHDSDERFTRFWRWPRSRRRRRCGRTAGLTGVIKAYHAVNSACRGHGGDTRSAPHVAPILSPSRASAEKLLHKEFDLAVKTSQGSLTAISPMYPSGTRHAGAGGPFASNGYNA